MTAGVITDEHAQGVVYVGVVEGLQQDVTYHDHSNDRTTVLSHIRIWTGLGSILNMARVVTANQMTIGIPYKSVPSCPRSRSTSY